MFTNLYKCPICKVFWEGRWECQCNDLCPFCRMEVEPCDTYDNEEDRDFALHEALWVLTEHNSLHFGEDHNTVILGRKALAKIKEGLKQ